MEYRLSAMDVDDTETNFVLARTYCRLILGRGDSVDIEGFRDVNDLRCRGGQIMKSIPTRRHFQHQLDEKELRYTIRRVA